MAIIEQQAVQQTPEPKAAARQRAPVWTTASQLRRSMPMIRLISELWAIPLVKKVTLLVDEAGVHVRVLIVAEDSEARSKIYSAERAYLHCTLPHGFTLWVSPQTRVGAVVPPPYETVLER
jgi:hypothetical protein